MVRCTVDILYIRKVIPPDCRKYFFWDSEIAEISLHNIMSYIDGHKNAMSLS